MIHSLLVSSGSHLPSRVVTNDDLAKLFPTSDAWIRRHIGVKERRFASSDEGVSDLALSASLQALKKASLNARDVDAIIFATSTPEFQAPGSGVLLQQKLGCRNIPAFDVRNTSPGFLFALDLADGLIKSGRYKTILIAGSEIHSARLDFSEQGRKMAVIFGDGAGVFILRAEKSLNGFQDFTLHSDGSQAQNLWCEKKFPEMNGQVVFQNAVSCMSSAIQELLKKKSLVSDDIDWIIAHQANLRILEAIQNDLKINPHKIPHNIEMYGNTSSASIPILFDELSKSKKIHQNQKIVLTSFGSGFSWGAGLLLT